MQTFLPYRSFERSARCLDRQRLGKQRVECLQILRTLEGTSTGWAKHPAVRMWRGHASALAGYGATVCDEWIRRGYHDTCRSEILFYVSIGDDPGHRGSGIARSTHRIVAICCARTRSTTASSAGRSARISSTCGQHRRREMSRFYDGQPVVCVWDRNRWRMSPHVRQTFVPARGEKYVVRYSMVDNYDGETRVVLTACGRSAWNERGFEPITENRVQAIIAMATDLPESTDIDITQPTPMETENV